jgi:tagaturonate reductase
VRGLSAAADWPEVERIFVEEAKLAISNTAEVGYDMPEGEVIGEGVPVSFPAKLTKLLHARFRKRGTPISIFPGELITQNGTVLKSICAGLAERSGLPADFVAWLTEKVLWANTLVDRIVSAALEPVGAVAEPYALWAIRKGGFDFLAHRDVRLVDDLEPYARLKLHILNLGHTVLAEGWMKRGAPADEMVRQVIDGGDDAKRLMEIYWNEVLPGFQRRGMGEEAQAYVATTLERFRNPFLEHRLADIAQNHAVKKTNRIGSFIDWVREKDPVFAAPRLAKVLAG